MSDLTLADAIGMALASARAWDADASAPEGGSLAACEQQALALTITAVFDAIPSQWREVIADTLAGLPDGQLWARSLQRAIAAGEQIIEMREGDGDERIVVTDESRDLERAFNAPTASEPTPRDASRHVVGVVVEHGPDGTLRPSIARPISGRLVI